MHLAGSYFAISAEGYRFRPRAAATDAATRYEEPRPMPTMRLPPGAPRMLPAASSPTLMRPGSAPPPRTPQLYAHTVPSYYHTSRAQRPTSRLRPGTARPVAELRAAIARAAAPHVDTLARWQLHQPMGRRDARSRGWWWWRVRHVGVAAGPSNRSKSTTSAKVGRRKLSKAARNCRGASNTLWQGRAASVARREEATCVTKAAR